MDRIDLKKMLEELDREEKPQGPNDKTFDKVLSKLGIVALLHAMSVHEKHPEIKTTTITLITLSFIAAAMENGDITLKEE